MKPRYNNTIVCLHQDTIDSQKNLEKTKAGLFIPTTAKKDNFYKCIVKAIGPNVKDKSILNQTVLIHKNYLSGVSAINTTDYVVPDEHIDIVVAE